MENDKCFCHFNGYQVKDAVARNEIESIKANVNAVSNEVATNKASITSINSDVSKSKTDIEVLKGDASTLKTTTSLNTASISANTENITNIDNKMGELENLTTDDKSSIVGAVNEIKGVVDSADTILLNEEVNTLKGKVETLESDNTTIKNDISELKNDEWIDFEPANSSWTLMQYKKKGKEVTIRCKSGSLVISGSDTLIANLPEEIKPLNTAYAYSISGGGIARISVNNQGKFNYDLLKDFAGNPVTTATWHNLRIQYDLD